MITNQEQLEKYMAARNQFVAASNSFLQKVCHSLNTIQRITLAYLISKIGRDDEWIRVYEIDLDELLVLLRWTNMRTTSIKDAIMHLTTAQWWLAGSETLNQGFITAKEVGYCKRIMEITFQYNAAIHLFGLRAGSEEVPMSIYRLYYLLPMKHRYSIRLYELMRSHSNRKEWIYEYGTKSSTDIQPMLAQWQKQTDGSSKIPASWERWGYFETEILLPALDEINKYTDLNVTHEALRQDLRGRSTKAVRSIRFTIHQKSTLELETAVQLIDSLYADYAKLWAPRFQAMEEAITVENGPVDADAGTHRNLPEAPVAQVPVATVHETEDDDDLNEREDEELIADPEETEREFQRLFAGKLTTSNQVTESEPVKRRVSRFGYDRSPQDQYIPDCAMIPEELDDNLPF